MDILLGYLFIFFARVVDVTMATLRTLMVVQGRKFQAAIIGFFEIMIYVTALNRVVNNLDNIGNLFAYALGFACGSYIGIFIESKIGLGNLSVQVILKHDDDEELINKLREHGYAVTKLTAYGREGTKDMLSLIISRKDLEELKKVIAEYDSSVFVTTSSVTPIRGGYFSRVKRK